MIVLCFFCNHPHLLVNPSASAPLSVCALLILLHIPSNADLSSNKTPSSTLNQGPITKPEPRLASSSYKKNPGAFSPSNPRSIQALPKPQNRPAAAKANANPKLTFSATFPSTTFFTSALSFTHRCNRSRGSTSIPRFANHCHPTTANPNNIASGLENRDTANPPSAPAMLPVLICRIVRGERYGDGPFDCDCVWVVEERGEVVEEDGEKGEVVECDSQRRSRGRGRRRR